MLKIRKMSKSDLEDVLEWRNSKIVRESMLNKELITWAEHLKWFEKCQKDNSVQNLIVEKDEKVIGVVNIVEINMEEKSCSWSIYLIGKQGKGVGTIMGLAIIKYIKLFLNMKKIYVQVLTDNMISKAFHKKIGFKIVGERSVKTKNLWLNVIDMEMEI